MIADRTYPRERHVRHLAERVLDGSLPCFSGCAVCHAFMELRPEAALPMIVAASELRRARTARDIAAGEA